MEPWEPLARNAASASGRLTVDMQKEISSYCRIADLPDTTVGEVVVDIQIAIITAGSRMPPCGPRAEFAGAVNSHGTTGFHKAPTAISAAA